MFFSKKEYHKSLIDKMSVTRYRNVEPGICYGVASVGLQAILLRDTTTYDERISCLYSIPSLGVNFMIDAARGSWIKTLTDIKLKLKKYCNDTDYQTKLSDETQRAWHQLSNKQRILLSANGFFDSIAVHQAPDEYQGLFAKGHKVFNQELLASSEIVLPEALEKQGNIALTGSFCGAYTVNEIHQLLVSLRSAIKAANIQFPIGLVLCSYNHAFTIGMDPASNKWMLIEANTGPTQWVGDYSLAKKINSLFSKNKITIFNTSIYTAGNNQTAATALIQKWKTSPAFTGSHDNTETRTTYKDSDSATLLYVAAQNNQTETVKRLIAAGADINYASYYTPSPLYIASYCGNIDVVKELLNSGAYVHADYYTGVSPLVSAAKHRHMDVVKLLLDHGANLFEIIRDTEVIKQLREYKTAIGEQRTNPVETVRKTL